MSDEQCSDIRYSDNIMKCKIVIGIILIAQWLFCVCAYRKFIDIDPQIDSEKFILTSKFDYKIKVQFHIFSCGFGLQKNNWRF